MGAHTPSIGIRTKLFLFSVALITVGILGVAWYLSIALEHDFEARVYDALAADVDMAATAIIHAGAFDERSADALVRDLGRAGHARVTLIDPRGRVVADSAVSRDRVPLLDNHAERPEVRAARETGRGTSKRDSNTVHESLIYAAQRFEGPGGHWVLRMAIAPQRLEAMSAANSRLLALGVLFGLLVAAALSGFAVQLFSRPLRALTATARAMLRDLSVRSRLRSTDELGALAGALDELADGLAASLESLERERDRLEAILESMAEGVLVTDTEGKIVLANRALREIFLLRRDVAGQAPIEAMRNADVHDLITEAARSGTPVSREVAAEGVRPRRLLARAAPLGESGGVVMVLSDVTDLRRLETVRRDFVANVSHELRTPIAAVRAAVETLQDGALQDPGTAREFVAIIERHAQRLHSLVEDLLDLSRIEAKELKLSPEPIDIGAAMAHAVDLLSLAADKKRIRLEATCEPGTPRVEADRRALETVLSNLIDNAIKYSPEGATVSLHARPHEGSVRVSVRDTGPGIEAKHLPRLFERFYRVDPGRSRQLGGTGLGLAIVKHLSDAMGARVTVESELGRGSTFFIDLRAAHDVGDNKARESDLAATSQ